MADGLQWMIAGLEDLLAQEPHPVSARVASPDAEVSAIFGNLFDGSLSVYLREHPGPDTLSVKLVLVKKDSVTLEVPVLVERSPVRVQHFNAVLESAETTAHRPDQERGK
ncbi:MAG: hypothetical protein OXT09_26940 [Myxococcales bacterium]|nr:hypothetical protein [Myxococcales bacterium]